MNRHERRDALVAAGFAAAALAIHALFWDRGFVLFDEGYVATMAASLRHGGHLYRDTVTYVPPGTLALLALAFGLAGESLRAGRALELGLTATMAALIYLVARAALQRPAAALAGLLGVLALVWAYPHWHVYHYSTPPLVAVMAGSALVAAWLRRGRLGHAAAAGLAIGLGILCKQSYGVPAAAALGVLLLVDGAARGDRGGRVLLPAAAFAAGVALPVAACLAAFARSHLLGDFVRQAVLAPLHGELHFGYVRRPSIWPLLHQDAALRAGLWNYLPPLLLELRLPAITASRLYRDTALVDIALKSFYYLPFLVLALAGARLAAGAWRTRPWRAWWHGERAGVLLVAVSSALLLGTNHPHDWVHVAIAYPGTILLAVWLIARSRAALVAAAALTLVACWPTLRLAAELRTVMDTPVDLPRAGVRARSGDAAVLVRLVSRLEAATRPDEPILVLPYHPLVYFLADRRPATRFLFVWYEYLPGRDAEIVRALDAASVRTVVYATAPAGPLGRLTQFAPALVPALAERYRVTELFGENPWGVSFELLAPRPAPPPGTVVVAARDAVVGARRSSGDADDVPPAALVQEAVWPFERVLSVRPTPGGTSELRLALPGGTPGQLVLGYGMHPDRWISASPSAYTFRASLERDGEVLPLLEERRDPQRRVEDRPWPERRFPVDGRPGTLVLAIVAPPGAPDEPDVVGWVLPRIEP